MVRNDGWLLVCHREELHLMKADARPVEMSAKPSDKPEEIASVLQQCLEESGHGGDPIAILLATEACLAATVPHTGRRMIRNHQSMAYVLEEFLPLAAEDMVCDFVQFDRDALGIAVEVSLLRPVLTALEEIGVPVASIAPMAMLAMQQLADQLDRQGRQLVLWQDGDRLEMFDLVDGKPHGWRSFPAKEAILIRELKATEAASLTPTDGLSAYNLSEELLQAARRISGNVRVSTQQPILQNSAAQTAETVLRGAETPWVELRREPFGDHDPYRPIRGRLRLLAACCACLLTSLTVAIWLRADQYENLAQSYQAEQEKSFRQAFPGRRVPIGIRSRLESEYQKLAGVTGHVADVPELGSASRLLRDALLPLPEDLRYRLLEIGVEQGRVFFDGEVQRHGDADLLASTLRKGGFTVDAPSTEQLAGKGVALTLTARRQSQATEKLPEEETATP